MLHVWRIGPDLAERPRPVMDEIAAHVNERGACPLRRGVEGEAVTGLPRLIAADSELRDPGGFRLRSVPAVSIPGFQTAERTPQRFGGPHVEIDQGGAQDAAQKHHRGQRYGEKDIAASQELQRPSERPTDSSHNGGEPVKKQLHWRRNSGRGEGDSAYVIYRSKMMNSGDAWGKIRILLGENYAYFLYSALNFAALSD